MAYFWTSITAAIAAVMFFCELPVILFPVLLFAVFLASGGKSFPRVFFRTVIRDSRLIYLLVKLQNQVEKHQKNSDTVADAFRRTVSKHPQKIAFIFERKTWTFQKVEDYSNRIANYFKSQGYQKGDVVALFLESCPEFVCIWLGLSKLGVISALINTNLRLESLWHCISVANVKAVIFGTELSDAVRDVQSRMSENLQLYLFGLTPPCTISSALNLSQELESSSPLPPSTTHTKSTNDVLMYLYTSGTTGFPKAAIITNIRYIRYSLVLMLYSVTAEDVIYCTLPLYHTAGGAIGVGACLVRGVTVALRKKFSASRFWDECVETKATVVQYIGELCRFLLATPYNASEKQHSVRLAVGNGLRPQIWQEFKSRFGLSNIGEFYGATEGTAAFFNIDNTPGSCGFVSVIAPWLLPVRIAKVDPLTGELLRDARGLIIEAKPGEAGHVVGKIMKGRMHNFDGYLNPEENSKKICHNVFKKGDSAFMSGDLVVKDEYGYIYFHDRTGDTFRWRGENVSTAEVESVMSKVLGLRDVTVYGVLVPGTEGRAGMAAIVDPTNTIDLVALAQSLKKLLPSYACPVFLRIVHTVDLTGTFKLQKSNLRKEGFDIGLIEDQLLYFDPKHKLYLSLDETKYEQIIHGQIRM